ncbi:MAG: hypothetical protein J2P43_03980 [Candidatus Dormibacteraeota bacterium]|nr:hypothetical protein [Candidatus Dormibacteraeota bacterium]MBO0744156.1 hypothetical protein [Candidatus Dormibacteraeota bacterium]
MRTPLDMLYGRINGFTKHEIVRRTVPCYKYVIEPNGQQLEVCLLVDTKFLYRWPYGNDKSVKTLAKKAAVLKGEMEDLRLREFQPGICRYAKKQKQEAPPAAASPETARTS